MAFLERPAQETEAVNLVMFYRELKATEMPRVPILFIAACSFSGKDALQRNVPVLKALVPPTWRMMSLEYPARLSDSARTLNGPATMRRVMVPDPIRSIGAPAHRAGRDLAHPVSLVGWG